jgi:hypothetical protein
VERRVVKLAVAVVLALASACSYGAKFEDCLVNCAGPGDCPSGMVCNTEHRCRPVDETGTCNAILGDAGLTGDGSSSNRCHGTATACNTFAGQTACADQTGCTFTSPVCFRTLNCSSIGTNQECMNTPGCQTDISTSTCKAIGGYCHGLTKDACLSLHPGECDYQGGCEGTPDACETLDSPACTGHAGCSLP